MPAEVHFGFVGHLRQLLRTLGLLRGKFETFPVEQERDERAWAKLGREGVGLKYVEVKYSYRARALWAEVKDDRMEHDVLGREDAGLASTANECGSVFGW